MVKKKKSDPQGRSLPNNVSWKGGAYYYHPKVKQDGKWKMIWTFLHHDYEPAMHEWTRITGRISTSRRMNAIFDRYMLEVAPKKAPRTYKDNMQQIKKLREFFGNMNADQVFPTDVYEFLDNRSKEAYVQANREVSLLSHIFSYAIRWGLALDNPCKHVKKNPEKPRERYVTNDEYIGVRALANIGNFSEALVKAMMGMAYVSGRREDELLNVNERTDVNDRGIIIWDGKAKKRKLVLWDDALRVAYQEAKAIPRKIGSFYLFANKRGQPYTTSGFYTNFKKLIKKALEKGVLRESFTFHDLRGKRGSDAASDEEACRILGHASVGVTKRHYRRQIETIKLS